MINFDIGKHIENALLIFSPKIELDISIDSFTFRKDIICKKFKTYLYVSKGEKKPRILSVGEVPVRAFEAIKIELFKTNNQIDNDLDKYDCLSAFLKHCIRAITSKFAMIRPTIVVSGVNELYPVLNGYQKKVMMNLLGDAGAARIIFKENRKTKENL